MDNLTGNFQDISNYFVLENYIVLSLSYFLGANNVCKKSSQDTKGLFQHEDVVTPVSQFIPIKNKNLSPFSIYMMSYQQTWAIAPLEFANGSVLSSHTLLWK